MALDIKGLKRVFKHGGVELSDPDITMTPDDVMSFYSNQYSELTTSTIQGPTIEGDKAMYHFLTTVGVKG